MIVEWFTAWVLGKGFGFLVKTIINQEFVEELFKDYAKDFFKNILNNAVTAPFKQEPLEKAVVMALAEFLQLMQQQLKVRCKLSEAEIKDYAEDIKIFITDKSIKEILSQAFNINCDSLEAKVLADSWKRLQLKPLPSKFNWQTITDQYLTQIQEILFDSEELRYILELQKLSSIDNTLKQNADIPKDFDLPKYLETIRERYSNLKLDSLETRTREHPVNLWQIFIPQNVRQVYQVLPELPKEYLRRLQESNQLDAEFKLENIKESVEGYKRNYLEQPIRSVLDVIRDKQRRNYLVILGEPGSGKSTLLQYLALDWVEETLKQDDYNLPIPLLIELRNYVRDRDTGDCRDFLEYYHKGPNCCFHLNQHKLHDKLKAGNALVMFDGLDEIFESTKREEVITCIHRFTNEYPDVQVIVTSRIIGYKQQQLRDAGFHHFMLQDLEPEQIQDFIERWHDKTFNKGEETDKNIKRERLQRVINESKAIGELARNPLLLTMMAILNLKRELPRDRSELYKDASEVLLHNWDEGRNLKPDERLDTIDYKDKQAMLRQVAYQMQTSENGLAGNIIYADNLEAIFTEYLQSIPVSDVRDKARRLMKQLVDRNFILCFLGADYYAFVHRTFLEFFCASEFVKRFEKRGTTNGISIEALKGDVFGKHWQDETWHEVLLLITGMIEAEFVGEIIDYLMAQEGENAKFINLFLAAKCLAEVRNRSVIADTANKLLNKLKELTKYDLWYYYNSYDETKLVQEIRTQAVTAIVTTWDDDPQTKTFLQQCASDDEDNNVRGAAIQALASNYQDDPQTKTILQQRASDDEDNNVRYAAISALASNYQDDLQTKTILQQCATDDDSWDVQYAAISALASNYQDDPQTKTILQQCATDDAHEFVRNAAIQALASNYPDDPQTKTILQQYATDDDSDVRGAAIQVLASNYKDDPQTKTFLQQCATDDDSDVRGAAIQALASNYPDDPQTKTILQQCATDDEHKSVQHAAIQALASNYPDDPQTKTFLQQRATDDDNWDVRRAAIQALASNYQDDPQTKTFLQQYATHDEDNNVQYAAIQALASNYKDDPQTKTFLQQYATHDEDNNVRYAAISVLASNYQDDPQTKTFLQQRASDDDADVRGAAISALAKHYRNQPELFDIYYNCAVNDPFERQDEWDKNLRRIALEIIIKQYPQHPQTLPLLGEKAENDPDEEVRKYAQKKLTQWEE
ncbi:MAG: HEAT repeat domain-containing protein [Nodularia sp. CChRGM 3473]